MDKLRLTFGFLMFHRRTIIGILLLVALYYFITEVVPRISAARRDTAHKRPTPTSTAEQPSDPNKTSVSKNPMESGKSLGETPNSNDGKKSANQLLKSESSDELIKELIRLNALLKKSADEGIALLLAADIIKICKRLLELPIDLNERKFALGSLTDALLRMRLIKINCNLADESIDVEFLKKTRELLADRDPVISSYAAFTIVTSAIFDFHTNPSDDRLAALDKLVNDHFEFMTFDTEQLNRFTAVLLKSNLSISEAPEVKAFMSRFGARLAAHPDAKVNEVGRAFTENLAFQKLDIENLVFHLGDRSAASDLKADAFFETLQNFPEASIPVYQISLYVVREYLIQNQLDRAMQLAKKLEKDILPKRKDDVSRARIQQALDELLAEGEKLSPRK